MLFRSLAALMAVFFLMFLNVNPADASRSVAAPVCAIKGIVISEKTRTEKGRGLSDGQEFKYHDVKIKVLENAIASEEEKKIFQHHPGCNPIGEITYQKRRESSLKGIFKSDPVIAGKCIRATTHFFADGNFMSGNWLYDIQVLDMVACKEDK